jgi:hypothetical protein
MNYLERIETIHPDIINHFLETGVSKAIDDDLKLLIQQLTIAVEIWDKERNITRAARKLKMRIFAEQRITVGLSICKQRIYDALNYFHVDCTVSNKFWLLNTADKLEDYALIAVKLRKPGEAARITKDALELRLRAKAEVSISDMKAPIILISDKMTLDEMGFEKKSLKEIAGKDNDAFYLKLISGLNTNNTNKKKLAYDAGIEDAKIITEFDNNGPE